MYCSVKIIITLMYLCKDLVVGCAGAVSEEFAKMHSIMKLNFLVKRKQNIMQTNVDGIETFAQIFIEYSLHNSASLE